MNGQHAMPRRRCRPLLAATFLLLASGIGSGLGLDRSVCAGEMRYVIIFGSERDQCPKPLTYTHTWALFVKTLGEGPDASHYPVVEMFTISWLPASLNVRVAAFHGEPGVNLDLVSTINYVRSNGETIDAWGPYVIGTPIYNLAVQQYYRLVRGEILYRAADTAFDPKVSDCIHAVSAVDPQFGRAHYPLIRVGKPASRYIAQNIFQRSLFDQRLYDNRWLLGRLGLTAYPITFHSSQTPP